MKQPETVDVRKGVLNLAVHRPTNDFDINDVRFGLK